MARAAPLALDRAGRSDFRGQDSLRMHDSGRCSSAPNRSATSANRSPWPTPPVCCPCALDSPCARVWALKGPDFPVRTEPLHAERSPHKGVAAYREPARLSKRIHPGCVLVNTFDPFPLFSEPPGGFLTPLTAKCRPQEACALPLCRTQHRLCRVVVLPKICRGRGSSPRSAYRPVCRMARAVFGPTLGALERRVSRRAFVNVWQRHALSPRQDVPLLNAEFD